MIIEAVAELRIQYDADLSLFRTAWVPGAPNTHYRAVSERLLDVAEQYPARHYLVDMSDVPDISVYDQLWLGRHWVPRGLRLPIARIVYCNQPARIHNQLAIESLLYLSQPFIKFDVQFFSEADAALDWLSDSSPRLPALLAEWEQHFGPSPPPDEVAEPKTPYQRQQE